jgi:hypothetical protein
MIRQAGAAMATQTNPANFFRPAWRPIAVLLGLLTPIGGHAAPFCIGSESLPPQCIYYDSQSCNKEAIKQGGVCSVNTKEVRLTKNIGQYCVVTSQRVSLCIYSDRSSCSAAAKVQGGACVSSPEVAPSGAPDPFSQFGGQ